MAEECGDNKYIKCSKCKCKYMNDDKHIKNDFGYNRLEERFKTCTKCRTKTNKKVNLIDKPTELLEYLNECLKPKTEEKKQFGEVFTPMKLVNEMLDKLDECYMKEHNKSIFEIRDFKWFDPANGMGNFLIAVYMRLIQYHDKKHILENMLYSSELNKKIILFIDRS